MADTVAWSNFQANYDEEKRQFTKRIKPGDKVSQADLGIEDEEWEALLESGAVREQPYPEAVSEGGYPDSPNRYFLDQLQKAAEGQLSADEVKELQASGAMPEAEVPVEETKSASTAKK